jgi:hypothetical protein
VSVIELIRGDTPTYDLELRSGDEALDLTGMGITFTAKRRYSDPDEDAVIRHDLDDGGVVLTSAIDGTATVHFSAADTAGLDDLPTLVWDVQVDDVAGTVITPLRGKLSVVRDVTRAAESS